MNQKYIITGAPGTGKTAIINELKKEDFTVLMKTQEKLLLNK